VQENGGNDCCYTAATYGLNEFNRRTFSEEEERAYRDTVAKDFETRTSHWCFIEIDGTIGSVNMSYYMPQTILGTTRNAALRGEDVDEKRTKPCKTFWNRTCWWRLVCCTSTKLSASGRDFKLGSWFKRPNNHLAISLTVWAILEKDLSLRVCYVQCKDQTRRCKKN